jgi:hypothetical protein
MHQLALLPQFGSADGIELFRQPGEFDFTLPADQQPFGSIQRLLSASVRIIFLKFSPPLPTGAIMPVLEGGGDGLECGDRERTARR